jgi:hypothetical protein
MFGLYNVVDLTVDEQKKEEKKEENSKTWEAIQLVERFEDALASFRKTPMTSCVFDFEIVANQLLKTVYGAHRRLPAPPPDLSTIQIDLDFDTVGDGGLGFLLSRMKTIVELVGELSLYTTHGAFADTPDGDEQMLTMLQIVAFRALEAAAELRAVFEFVVDGFHTYLPDCACGFQEKLLNQLAAAAAAAVVNFFDDSSSSSSTTTTPLSFVVDDAKTGIATEAELYAEVCAQNAAFCASLVADDDMDLL